MRKAVIIGAETHIGEVTPLIGKEIEVVGALAPGVDETDGVEAFGVPLFATADELYATTAPGLAVISNPNDLKAEAILAALAAGCDVIVDKPLAITWEEQAEIESALAARPERRLLNMLTLRGHPLWAGFRNVIVAGEVGRPAFTHVRMSVRLKRDQRPPWFLDTRRSGGVFLDLLIHGLDQVEWVTGSRIVAVSAVTGNIGDPSDTWLRDHASIYCELEDGGSALVEGQRMMPSSKGSDYRMMVAGTEGYADLYMQAKLITLTNAAGAEMPVEETPPPVSVIGDWLAGGDLVGQRASLRANRLALAATQAADEKRRIAVDAS